MINFPFSFSTLKPPLRRLILDSSVTLHKLNEYKSSRIYSENANIISQSRFCWSCRRLCLRSLITMSLQRKCPLSKQILAWPGPSTRSRPTQCHANTNFTHNSAVTQKVIFQFLFISLFNRPFYSCGSVTRPMNGSEAAGDLVLMGLPRCKNLWSFSLFCHYYVRSIYCFDFFVFFVLRHSWRWQVFTPRMSRFWYKPLCFSYADAG